MYTGRRGVTSQKTRILLSAAVRASNSALCVQRFVLTSCWRFGVSFRQMQVTNLHPSAVSNSRILHLQTFFADPIIKQFNLLKPTGYVMHQQLNIQQLYVLPTHCIYVFCIYLRTNSDLCHLQHKLIGFYNRDEKCLLHGTNWAFK